MIRVLLKFSIKQKCSSVQYITSSSSSILRLLTTKTSNKKVKVTSDTETVNGINFPIISEKEIEETKRKNKLNEAFKTVDVKKIEKNEVLKDLKSPEVKIEKKVKVKKVISSKKPVVKAETLKKKEKRKKKVEKQKVKPVLSTTNTKLKAKEAKQPVKVKKKKKEASPQQKEPALTELNIYCDGSCLNNGITDKEQTAGVGVHIPGMNGKYDLSQSIKNIDGPLTNNYAEILAAIHSLNQASVVLKDHPNKYNRIVIHSDSAYVINAITTWIHDWSKNGWKAKTGKPIENLKGFQELLKLTQDFKDVKIVWKHVKGHVGHEQNEITHNLAYKASRIEKICIK